jgi:hypothetical protein
MANRAPLALPMGLVASAFAWVLSAACYSIPDVDPADGGDVMGVDAPLDGPLGSADTGTRHDASVESGSSSHDGGNVTDVTTPPPDGPCGMGILCPCSANSDCTSTICGTSTVVTGSIISENGGENFCTQACCTSNDCPAGTVCFASGTGQYCVRAAWLDRSKPGSSAAGGASCTNGAGCRSGLCSGGSCIDTCCEYGSTECAGGACIFGNFPGAASFDVHFAAHCGSTAGTGGYSQTCGGNSDCQGGYCYNDGTGPGCTMPCRTSADCSGGACQYIQTSTGNYVAACYLPGGTGQGTSCSSDQSCSGYFCSPSGCTEPCFADSDCSNNWRCRSIAGVMSGELLLACGP